MNRQYISYSQLNMYSRCGMQYYYRYAEKIILPPEIALVKGHSVHYGIEINSTQKVETRRDMPKKDIMEISVMEYEHSIEGAEATADDKGAGKDSVAVLSGLYADEVSPTIQPVHVEKSIDVTLEGVIPIKTIIDCIDDQGNLRDYKTAGKKKVQKDIDDSLQFTLYHIAYLQEYGKEPASLKMDVLIDKKTPEYQILESKRSIENGILAVRKIHAVVDALQKEVFLPAPEGSWICSPQYCGYYRMCRFKQSGQI